MRGNERRENKKINLRNEDKLNFSYPKQVTCQLTWNMEQLISVLLENDTILEEGRNLYEVLDLKFGACKMCVCGPKEAKKYLNSNEIIRVASKYPHIAKEYFNNQKLQTVEIVKLNGSVELAPIVGLSEVIVDIVETGTTLKENGLEVLEEVCPLSARMVVNQVSQKMEQERISKIIVALKKILDEKRIGRRREI